MGSFGIFLLASNSGGGDGHAVVPSVSAIARELEAGGHAVGEEVGKKRNIAVRSLSPLAGGHPRLQPWRFVALEVRIVAAEQEALQSVGVAENLSRDAFPLHLEEIGETVDGGDDFCVDQRVGLRQLGVAPCRLEECPEGLGGVLALVGKRGLKIDPTAFDLRGQTILLRRLHSWPPNLWTRDD